MRKITALLGAAAVGALAILTQASPSLAGGRGADYVCWMQTSGVTACAYLPEPYEVRDIDYKPHRHKDRKRCTHCYVDSQLTHRNIRDLSRYTDASSMRRGHDMTVFGDKVRGQRD